MVPLFDIVSTIEVTASAALVAAFLAFVLSPTAPGRRRALLVIAAWFLVVVVLGATGALDARSGLGVPGLGAAVALPLAVLCLVLLRDGSAREAMLAIPVSALVAINSLRVLGVMFLLLHAAHRLPAPFAPVAGWGDILVGATAGPVAWIAARSGARAQGLVLVWNIVGFFDLVAAIGLGAASSPGPFRLFLDPPGTPIMTTLPWIIVPCFLVPIFEALHVVIFYRLGRSASRLSSRGPHASGLAAR